MSTLIPVTLSTLPAPPPKVCGCGLEHDAFAWSRLPFVGMQDAGDGEVLCLRNCNGCGSTLAIEVSS